MLVSDPTNRIFEGIPREWLITNPTPSYTSALATLLAELASDDPTIAGGIALRAANGATRRDTDDQRRSLYATIVCRLVADARAGRVKFEYTKIDPLLGALEREKIECKLDKGSN